MPYVPVNLSLSLPKMKRLLAGDEVPLTMKDLEEKYPFHLTATQARQVEKARSGSAKGKLMSLKLSQSHRMHVLKQHLAGTYGGGFWDSIGNWLKKAGSYVYNKIAKPIAQAGLSGLQAGVQQGVAGRINPLAGMQVPQLPGAVGAVPGSGLLGRGLLGRGPGAVAQGHELHLGGLRGNGVPVKMGPVVKGRKGKGKCMEGEGTIGNFFSGLF